MAKIKWKSYKTFRNDFIKFNKLPMFKNTPSGHGTKLREAAEKKLAAKAKKEAQRHKLLTKLNKKIIPNAFRKRYTCSQCCSRWL